MQFCRKCRRLEALDGVARRALRPPRPFGELAIVWIWFVTIDAGGECDRLFEISACMAECAIHGRVFTLQRILGLRVIEVPIDRRQRNSLPAFGVVTGLAALRETAMVHVCMAIRALAKRYARIARLALRPRRMALFTLHLHVRSGQQISCLGVVELANRNSLPIGGVVALGTVRTQPSLMRIFVAGGAGLRNAQKAARQVLDLDRRALHGSDMLGGMASGACYSGVFAFQNITGDLVIEGLSVPFDKRKILTIVFRVAAGAFVT